LAQDFRADLSGRLGSIVDTGAAVIVDAVKRAAESSKPGVPVPPPSGPGYFRPAWFGEAYAAAKAGVDMLLTGPAGTGKSRAGREIAAALDRPAHVFACKAGMRRADLFYAKELENGETVVRLAPLLQAVQEPGVVVLDEVFALDPEILLGLNGLLESGQRSIDTPTGTVERHPDNLIILTANTAGRQESRAYRGAQAQDASTLSRVLIFRTAYDPAVELEIAKAHGLTAKDAGWLCDQVKALRDALGRAQVAHDVTPRAITQAARLIGAGLTRERAARLALLGPLEPSEVAKVQGSLDPAIPTAA
jgi:MoxR-like ATPase